MMIAEEGDYYEKLAYYMMLSKYSEHFDTFVDCLVCYPVLRSRMINLHDECTKRIDLHRIIDRYGQRVSWHLYRVYRARNTITHSGKRPNDLKDLGEHLHSYVDRLANETIIKLSMGALCHISNILIDSELQQEEWESYLKKSDRIDEQCIQKIFDPQTIMWNHIE